MSKIPEDLLDWDAPLSEQSKTEEKEYHFFAQSRLGWNCDESLSKCLAIRKREDNSIFKERGFIAKSFNVWKVPLAIDEEADYAFDNQGPDVEGTVHIETIQY